MTVIAFVVCFLRSIFLSIVFQSFCFAYPSSHLLIKLSHILRVLYWYGIVCSVETALIWFDWPWPFLPNSCLRLLPHDHDNSCDCILNDQITIMMWPTENLSINMKPILQTGASHLNSIYIDQSFITVFVIVTFQNGN